MAPSSSSDDTTSMFDDTFTQKERQWIQITAADENELARLNTLATEMTRNFIKDELKDAAIVSEIVSFASVLNQQNFKLLLEKFLQGIGNSLLEKRYLLEGLAQMMQRATRGYLEKDDLVKILQLLNTRLNDIHLESNEPIYQLTRTVSHVLDAMVDSDVKHLKRELLHEPLSAHLKSSQESSDPYLVYQTAYAFQALQYVPDDETFLQAALRRTGKVAKGVSGIVSAMKSLDLCRLFESLQNIQQGLTGTLEFVGLMKDAYTQVASLAESGKAFLACLQEGFSFDRKSAWYPALRAADTLLQNGQLVEFKELACQVACRRDPAFQWGLCERLGQLATNADPYTRQGAVAFLGELYKNDVAWGQHVSIKQWILKILIHLSDSSVGTTTPDPDSAAQTLLQALANEGDESKRDLYKRCLQESEKCGSPYPMKAILPLPGSPSLLDRVQNKPDVEADLRRMKQQRLKERGGPSTFLHKPSPAYRRPKRHCLT
ncbi:hypothetical protein BGZ79_001736 [Entomortierella chlamydospora]|nr:hypothetical protein BGZ79_001736 [Entomortierella chlamydospora]